VTERRYRLLLISTHPVQYAAPIFRDMQADPRLEIQVAYCSNYAAESAFDKDFGREIKWDVPLFEGYSWTMVPNRSFRPGLERFFGLVNPGLWSMIRKGRYDAVSIFAGYRYASFWITLAAAKFSSTPIFFGTDAASLDPRNGGGWKVSAKRWLWPKLFGMADQVVGPSTATRGMYRSLGIPEDRIMCVPYIVDNSRWLVQSAKVDRAQVRAEWKVPVDATVIVFSAKLQPWKRPLDLLEAFAKANAVNSFLIYAGDGPLMNELQTTANSLGIADRVRFLGFVNQSQLPAVYTASDLLVLPSDYEPFGVVVNEAMLCGAAVAVSDHVGAGHDLVTAKTGFIFPCGDVEALANVLRLAAENPTRLRDMGCAGRRRMETWSSRELNQAYVEGIERAISLRNRRKG
jgi:glycosyltransferase involved in cell wall biosynthesis